MNKKCPNCRLVNFSDAQTCRRCDYDLVSVVSLPGKPENSFARKLILRFTGLIVALLIAIGGFYLSLIGTAARLSYEQKQQVYAATRLLRERGFSNEAFLLDYFSTFRANDNWLNASTQKENAYAATNFPFEIVTIYPDFFVKTTDDLERAAILLHEAQHLKGKDEKEAYEFVWKNREKLGWTKDTYANSKVWKDVRNQTKEYLPNLFICELNDFGDCTEPLTAIR